MAKMHKFVPNMLHPGHPIFHRSGTGHSMSMYENQLVPELQSNGVRHQLIKTEYAGHARKVASELDLAEYSGIVCISGDGLVHEVYNGLYARKDWDEKASKYD